MTSVYNKKKNRRKDLILLIIHAKFEQMIKH